MASLVADGLVSPELVLVAPPEEAEEARAALPDVLEFYDWIGTLRELSESQGEGAVVVGRRGAILFGTLVCLNAVAPLLLLILLR